MSTHKRTHTHTDTVTCTHAHTRVHSHTHTAMCICAHIRVHTHTHRHTLTLSHAYMHTRVHTQSHSHVHPCTHLHTHTHMSTCTHTLTPSHANMHTHMCTLTRIHCHMHAHSHTLSRTCMHPHTCAHSHSHIHMHCHVHTHTQTHTLASYLLGQLRVRRPSWGAAPAGSVTTAPSVLRSWSHRDADIWEDVEQSPTVCALAGRRLSQLWGGGMAGLLRSCVNIWGAAHSWERTLAPSWLVHCCGDVSAWSRAANSRPITATLRPPFPPSLAAWSAGGL